MLPINVCFSNRPFEIKHFQTIRRCGVDVTHGLVLLFGIGTNSLRKNREVELLSLT